MTKTLVWVEHDGAAVKDATLSAVTAASQIGVGAASADAAKSPAAMRALIWSRSEPPSAPASRVSG